MTKTKKSKTDTKDTPKDKSEKESIPKEPLIIEPLYKGKDYPRMEVFVDNMNATVGVRMDAEDNIKHPGFCSPTSKSILRLIDSKMFHEKLIAKREKDFEPSLKNFIKMVKQHNTQIMRLAGALEDGKKTG